MKSRSEHRATPKKHLLRWLLKRTEAKEGIFEPFAVTYPSGRHLAAYSRAGFCVFWRLELAFSLRLGVRLLASSALEADLQFYFAPPTTQMLSITSVGLIAGSRKVAVASNKRYLVFDSSLSERAETIAW
jgi:hypothetical protein